MKKFTAISLLSLAAGTFAVPMAGAGIRFSGPYPTKAVVQRENVKGTAINGAMSTPTAAPKVAHGVADSPPEYVTITVVNSYGKPLTTSHSNAPGVPTPISGNVGTGTLAANATDSFAVPTGWIGNIAVNDAKYEVSGDDSLIEANFVVPNGGTDAWVDVDISYVDGYSVPIVCSCNNVVVTGCNLDLFKLNTCPDNDGQNACVNPLRANTLVTAATDFFAPCSGMSYTFPKDSGANSYGFCQSGHITCCVGTACPPNPKQTS